MAAELGLMKEVQVKLEPLDPDVIKQAQSGKNGVSPTIKVPKKRGRPKKVKDAESGEPPIKKGVKKELKQELITDGAPVKKKRDRFKGTTEEEVLTRKLPDHLDYGLDIVIIGINPGLTAAYTGHYFAGPGNHFWKCLFLSGLIPYAMNAYDDDRLKEYGIGFTNIVERTSRGYADLSKKEVQEGAEILKGKIRHYRPKIAVFNGKGIYEIFSGRKDFFFGKQPQPFPDAEETQIFVMPSSSARFTQLPRAVDKVPFYEALKKYRNYLRGDMPSIEDSEITFPDLQLKTAPRKEPPVKKEPEEGEKKSEVKPKVKKPRKKRTQVDQMQGHITGGSTKLTKAHKSLIEQALMFSEEPGPTDSGAAAPPSMSFPAGFDPAAPPQPNNAMFQQGQHMAFPPLNAMGDFNPVTTAGSMMDLLTSGQDTMMYSMSGGNHHHHPFAVSGGLNQGQFNMANMQQQSEQVDNNTQGSY